MGKDTSDRGLIASGLSPLMRQVSYVGRRVCAWAAVDLQGQTESLLMNTSLRTPGIASLDVQWGLSGHAHTSAFYFFCSFRVGNRAIMVYAVQGRHACVRECLRECIA